MGSDFWDLLASLSPTTTSFSRSKYRQETILGGKGSSVPTQRLRQVNASFESHSANQLLLEPAHRTTRACGNRHAPILLSILRVRAPGKPLQLTSHSKQSFTRTNSNRKSLKMMCATRSEDSCSSSHIVELRSLMRRHNRHFVYER